MVASRKHQELSAPGGTRLRIRIRRIADRSDHGRRGGQEIIWFCATGKSGLGHLRRCTSVVRQLRALEPTRPVGLLTNSPPAGLPGDEVALWTRIEIAARDSMADFLSGETGLEAVVVDTAQVPGIERLGVPLALILRETPGDRLARLALPNRGRWELVVVPNPADHWMPDPVNIPAAHIAPVGWIYRRVTGPAAPGRHVLIATGGGGTEETAGAIRAMLAPVLEAARTHSAESFEVVQALGPRAPAGARVDGVDRVVDPGGDLNRHFAEAGVVISTAGYNSVLELAGLDVPTMLVAIPRSIDDQIARARLWGPRLGHFLDRDAAAAGRWLASAVGNRTRRAPWDLGPSGGRQAAELILGLAR